MKKELYLIICLACLSLSALASSVFMNKKEANLFNKNIQKELRRVKRNSRHSPWNDSSRIREFTYVGMSFNGCSNDVFSDEISNAFNHAKTEQLANNKLNTLIANLFMTADLMRSGHEGDNDSVVMKNIATLNEHVLLLNINKQLASLGKSEITGDRLIEIIGRNPNEICKKHYLADDLTELVFRNM